MCVNSSAPTEPSGAHKPLDGGSVSSGGAGPVSAQHAPLLHPMGFHSSEALRPLRFDVWLRVVKARSLPAKGLLGSTDAFARCLWGYRGPAAASRAAAASATHTDGTPMIAFQTDLRPRTRNPRWDFERVFLYKASAEALREQSLVVQVFHRSPILGDEPIGSVRLTLYEIATAPMLFDLPLSDGYGRPAGRVSLNIRMQQLCSLGVSMPSVTVQLSRVRAARAPRAAGGLRGRRSRPRGVRRSCMWRRCRAPV